MASGGCWTTLFTGYADTGLFIFTCTNEELELDEEEEEELVRDDEEVELELELELFVEALFGWAASRRQKCRWEKSLNPTLPKTLLGSRIKPNTKKSDRSVNCFILSDNDSAMGTKAAFLDDCTQKSPLA